MAAGNPAAVDMNRKEIFMVVDLTMFQFAIMAIFIIVGAVVCFYGVKITTLDSMVGPTVALIGVIIVFAGIYFADYSLLKDKENVVAQCGKDNYAIYIDGNPVGDEFSVDGIDLKDYTVKVGDNKLFLISD